MSEKFTLPTTKQGWIEMEHRLLSQGLDEYEKEEAKNAEMSEDEYRAKLLLFTMVCAICKSK